jgi:aryl-alcohol dehydrogenase-like predicted oxidoreductase
MNIIDDKRALGQSGVKLSPIALGTVKFGRNQGVKYPKEFDLPSDDELAALLNSAKIHGITTLDTATAYGFSEKRLGFLLNNQRHDFQIISKAGEHYDMAKNHSHYDYSIKRLRAQLENSLRVLNTDYLDCWLLHSDGNDEANLNDDVLLLLQKVKQEGLVRSVGASTKTVAGGNIALEELDCVMMTASLNYHDEDALFAKALQLNKGILLKKILDSGWALNQEGGEKMQTMVATYQHLFKQQASCAAVIGTLTEEHLMQNLHAFIKANSNE